MNIAYENSGGSIWWERTLRIVNDLIRHCADLEKDDQVDDPYTTAYAATIKKLLICSLFELRSQFERIEKHLERHHLFTDRLRDKYTDLFLRWDAIVQLHGETGTSIDFNAQDLGLTTLLDRSEEFRDLDPGSLLELADAAEGLAHRIRAQLSETVRTQDLY